MIPVFACTCSRGGTVTQKPRPVHKHYPHHEHREVCYPCGCCWSSISQETFAPEDGLTWLPFKGYICETHRADIPEGNDVIYLNLKEG